MLIIQSSAVNAERKLCELILLEGYTDFPSTAKTSTEKAEFRV